MLKYWVLGKAKRTKLIAILSHLFVLKSVCSINLYPTYENVALYQ